MHLVQMERFINVEDWIMEGWNMQYFLITKIRKMDQAVRGIIMWFFRGLLSEIKIYANLLFIRILNVRLHSLRWDSIWTSLLLI